MIEMIQADSLPSGRHSAGVECRAPRRLSCLLIVWVFVGISGCSESATAPSPDETQPATGTQTAESRATPQSTGQAQRRRDEVWVDEEGRKWFGNIPYDVFYDHPYEVAANQTPLNGQPQIPNPDVDPLMDTTPGDNDPGESPSPTPDNSASDGIAVTWDQLIDVQTLDDEVKSIRNFFNENLQTVGNFNSSMLMIPPKAATMAILAEVALQHPQEVSWKEDAGYIRDLASQMNAETLQRGAKTQRRLLALYENISDTLNRSRPAGLEEPQPVDSFADVAEMRMVMMRMEAAANRMRTEAGSEGAFTTNKDMVRHEAALLAAMSHTVTLPGYGYADDEQFVGFGQKVANAARSIVAAADAGDFATYDLSLSTISTTCQACHSEYND